MFDQYVSDPVPGVAGRVSLFGHDFFAGSATGALNVAIASQRSGPRLVVTANMDHVITLTDNAEFRAAYDDAAVRTIDGMPVVWLARARSGRWPERVTGHDLLAAALDGPSALTDRVFALAPNPAVAAAITSRFRGRGPACGQIKIVVPPFGFEKDETASNTLARAIASYQTSLLLMGVGAPKSEVWVARMGARLGRPVVLCVGEALAVAAGVTPRAPRSMQRTGLEWLWRFGLSPRRLFYRYFVRSWRFPMIALRNPDLRP